MNKIISFIFLFTISTTPLFGQWNTHNSVDEMTGESSNFAISPAVTSTTQMSFPYGGTEGRLVVACNEQQEFTYLMFTQSPNLLNTDTQDGYDRISTRIRWDDEVENITMTQEWGSSALHFRHASNVISKIMSSNKVLLELNWYGNGRTYFEFSLNGSADAISKIRQSCSG